MHFFLSTSDACPAHVFVAHFLEPMAAMLTDVSDLIG